MRDKIISEIKRYSRHLTTLTGIEKNEYFDEPLIGFADALDPLFTQYKEVVGDFHWTPKEIFESKYEKGSFYDGTVISWILPITEAIIKSNYSSDKLPSQKWAYSRNYGELINEKLRIHLVDYLCKAGYKSVAPALSPFFKRITSKRVGRASKWSERHVAYAAGLGTFSLSDGLITTRGVAHRCGSIVTNLKTNPTKRPYDGIYDYCLHYSAGSCGLCIKRCPAKAISNNGHDKELCAIYARDRIRPSVNDKYSVVKPGCGLCQTNVPCEMTNPIMS